MSHSPSGQVRPLRRLPEAAAADARYVALAAVVASVVTSAGTPSLVAVALAALLAAPDLPFLSKGDTIVPTFFPALLWLALWASVAWSRNPDLSRVIAFDQLLAVVLFVAVRVALVNRRAVILVGGGYLLGCLMLLRKLLEQKAAGHLGQKMEETTRFTVEGVNANYIAYTMAGAVAVAVLLMKVAPRATIVLVSITALCGYAIWLTGTRGALVSAVLISAWVPLVPARRRQAGLRAILAGTSIIAVAIVFGFADGRIRSWLPHNSFRETGDLNGRLRIWPIAREYLFDHPWLGEGAGTITTRTPHAVFAHNAILDVGTGAGIVGIAALIATLYVVIFRATRDFTDAPTRLMLIGVLICATAPPLLTGYWYQAAPLWVLLALFSRMGSGVNLTAQQRSRGVSSSRHYRPASPGPQSVLLR